MIKITYKDYVIEVETLEQAQQLISDKKKVGDVPVSTKKTPRTYVRSGKYKKLKGKYNRWTKEEVIHLLDMLERKVAPYDIKKDPILRTRHNRVAISQMLYNAKNNRSDIGMVAKEIGDIIKGWHGEETVTKLEVKHV